METGKMINRISNRLRRRSRAIQEAIGISGAQGNILDYILIESPSHSVYQKEIEQEFGLRPSTATEALKSLEMQGLIRSVLVFINSYSMCGCSPCPRIQVSVLLQRAG